MPKRHSKSTITLKTATASTPEMVLQRHLKELGLASACAYRDWCRQNGFGTNLYKSGRERRQECRAALKLAAKAQAEATRLRHLAALGMKTDAEYEDWCRLRGLRGGAKSAEARQQEIHLAQQEVAQAVMADVRHQMRHPEDVLRRLYRGEIAPSQVKTAYLQRVADIFTRRCLKRDIRDAFLRLLLHAHKVADFTALDPVIPYIGPQPENTFVEGLLALARHHGSWLRPLEDWKPDTRNPRQQFASLARYLLTDYAVPAFMDAAWFLGETDEAWRKQDWFKLIGLGINIRRANLPLVLTEKAAHHFQFAPSDYSIEAALRWGQIRALGGSEALTKAIVATRLGERFDHEDFWLTVLHFFVNNPMLDRSHIGPIVDYLHHVKFVSESPEGPQEPEFSMKGRTANALLERVTAWHRQIERVERKRQRCWNPSGIEEFHWRERNAAGEEVYWTIREILSARQLYEEGKMMHHCVGTYASSCLSGAYSIWSMRVKEGAEEKLHRVLTLSVLNSQRRVTEVRGKCNVLPSSKKANLRLQATPALLKLWATQAGLTLNLPL